MKGPLARRHAYVLFVLDRQRFAGATRVKFGEFEAASQ
jgi:hypothetical protein